MTGAVFRMVIMSSILIKNRKVGGSATNISMMAKEAVGPSLPNVTSRHL